MRYSFSRIVQLLSGLFLNLMVAVSSIGLLALSGWLICAAGVAGLHAVTAQYFNYFLPASGIRFFAIVRILSRYAERIITHDVTFKILTDLRVWFYKKIEPLVPAYLMRYRSADLLNRSVSDINTLDQLYLRIFMPFSVALLMSFCLLYFYHFFSWKIAWVVFSSMLVVILLVTALMGILGLKISRRLQEITRDCRIHIVDFYAGLKELLIYSAHFEKAANLYNLTKLLYRAQKRLSHLRGFSFACLHLIAGSVIIYILYCSISLVQSHNISDPIVGVLVLALLAVFELLMPLPIAFQNVGSAASAVMRLKEVANEVPSVTFPKRTKDRVITYNIRINAVDFQYEMGRSVFSGLDLVIPFKQKLLITGSSGVGKTTLLHLVARLYDPVEGSISIGGVPLKAISEFDFRGIVTLLSQQEHFFNESVRENLLISKPNASDDELWSVLRKVKLSSVLQSREGGLDASMGEFGQYFSAGQLRRFSIARALLHNTPILLLDEPTESLDRNHADNIWNLLLSGLRDQTVIVVTHRQPAMPAVGSFVTLNL